jgi:NADPH:quinone reductase-like Zn-dependent oxidoreductase
MKAVRIRQYGEVDTISIDEVQVPEIGPSEVLVKIEAASVNPLDVKLIRGILQEYFPLTLPYALGTDLSGTIARVGRLAVGWREGDRVFARLEPGPGNGNEYGRGGAFAEFAAVPARHLAAAPTELDFALSAALPTAAATAWQALFEVAGLDLGQSVLIHAGAGGVGGFAVQLAKYVGARVTATTSGENVELVRNLGADRVIDYRKEDFVTGLKDIDVVLDTIGGETQLRSYAVLRPHGTLVTITSPPDPQIAAQYGVRALRVGHESDAARLALVAGICGAGALRVVVDSTFPLAEVKAALSRSASGSAHGKILLRPNLQRSHDERS